MAPNVINKQDAHALLKEFQTNEQFDARLEELKAYWAELLSRFTVQSEDDQLNRQVNVWNQFV